VANIALHIGNTISVLGTVNPRRRNLSPNPSPAFCEYTNPAFEKTRITLQEAHNQKLNIDNIRTSIFTKTGEMQTLTIHDYEGYSTYDYIQHGTPIAIMGRIEVKLAANYCAPELVIGHLYILDDTPRRFEFPKLDTPVSSASSTPTKSKKRIMTDI
jgi:hypothetical protein